MQVFYLRILNKKLKIMKALIYRQRSLQYAFTYISVFDKELTKALKPA